MHELNIRLEYNFADHNKNRWTAKFKHNTRLIWVMKIMETG